MVAMTATTFVSVPLFRLWHRPEGPPAKPLFREWKRWSPVFGPATEQQCEAEFRRLTAADEFGERLMTGEWIVLAEARDPNETAKMPKRAKQ